ncbi:hypothetical protein EBB79_08995 [Parasedimentitalea marina]|uniref:AAA domain-containing protein n=2 Tax=Parasedimentitalea marina TaxID=2483033 RepID=A0A3T0N1X7_9RHOB|nr:hypothetical protein EBB79_08995 [Parasedimentitalea marina]
MMRNDKELVMKNDNKSIALISKDPGISALVESVVQLRPGTELTKSEATLTEMNGTASELAMKNDLVIFCPEGNSERDAIAIREIRQRTKTGAQVIALADANTPFSEMRKLSEAGAADVLPDNLSPDELAKSIWQSLDTADARSTADALSGTVVSVAQARGGIGSTTVAVNLADCLTQRTGWRKQTATNKVALVDLDLQFGAVSTFLNQQPSSCLYQMADEGVMPDSTFLEQSMIETTSGLWVLPSPSEFVPLHALAPRQTAELIQLLQARFDYVVIDLPRVLVEWLSPVLEASDRLVMVTDCSVPAVSQARRLLDFYSEVNLGLEVDIVINRKRKPLFAASHEKEAARVLQRPFKYWLAEDSAAALKAADQGIPLSKAAARSPLAKGIRHLAQAVAEARQSRTSAKN